MYPKCRTSSMRRTRRLLSFQRTCARCGTGTGGHEKCKQNDKVYSNTIIIQNPVGSLTKTATCFIVVGVGGLSRLPRIDCMQEIYNGFMRRVVGTCPHDTFRAKPAYG